MSTIDHTADIIDIRDIIERFEELEEEMMGEGEDLSTQRHELVHLTALLEGLKVYGGDERWRGDWYPGVLIRETYFRDYAIELLNDAGDLEHIPAWVEIDWEGTVENVRGDYSPIVIDSVTYWYR
jgi:hypothetical protein